MSDRIYYTPIKEKRKEFKKARFTEPDNMIPNVYPDDEQAYCGTVPMIEEYQDPASFVKTTRSVLGTKSAGRPLGSKNRTRIPRRERREMKIPAGRRKTLEELWDEDDDEPTPPKRRRRVDTTSTLFDDDDLDELESFFF